MTTRPLTLVLLTALWAFSQEILAPGNPPLTETLVSEYARAMGTLLDIPVTPADVDFFRAALRADWAAKQKLRLGILQAKREVDSKPAAERAAGLQAIRPRIVAMLESSAAAGDQEARFLIARLARPATGIDDARLDALLQPRRQNDDRLDSDGIPANQLHSTYQPRVQRSDNDAFAALVTEIGTERSYLHEGDLAKMLRYFEWSLEVPLLNSERNQLRRQLLALHRSNGGKDPAFEYLRHGIGFNLGGLDMSFLDDPFADHKRRAVQRERVPQLARDAASSALSRWLYARYQAAHPALTPPPQVLTPHVARVYAEHVVFAVNEVVGQNSFAVTPELTRALLKKLLAEWPGMTAAHRQSVCDLPFDWAATKQGWPGRPDYQKTEMRLAWGKEFSAVFPEVKPFHEARAAEVAKAKAKVEAEHKRRAAPETARQAALTPEQRAQEFIQQQMLANQMATAAFQNQMQMQQQTIRTMQLGQLQMHVANLNIASNIGGGGTTWHIVNR